MIATPRVIEQLTKVAPLGLRFHDVVTGEFVGKGLNVTAYPQNNKTKRVNAFPNPSGVYVLHSAPGLKEFEHGPGDERFWNEIQIRKSFVIEVSDSERRFLPFSFGVQLPVKGIYSWSLIAASSPLSSPLSSHTSGTNSIPLYSSPTRSIVAGMAVMRADLWDAAEGKPAKWAVIEAYSDGQLIGRGIADEEGRLNLTFPYPKPRISQESSPLGLPVGSPLAAAREVSFVNQAWAIELRARYQPNRASSPPPPLPPLEAETKEVPDLRETLSQPLARLWSSDTLNQPLTEVQLRYGHELVLKSRASLVSPLSSQQKSASGSVLFVTETV